MDAYKRINRLFELLSIGISAAGAQAIISLLLLLPGVQMSPGIGIIITGIGVVILNEIVSHLLQDFYSSFEPIRRIFLGKQYVEETWIEFIFLRNTIESVSITTIESCGLELQTHGYNYDLNGNLRYDFNSQQDMVKMEWAVFRYAYEDRPFQGENTSVEGVAHIKFGITKDKPSMYTGAFLHTGTGKLTGIEARLIKDKKDLALLQEPSQVRNIVQKYVEERLKEIKGDAATAVALSTGA